MKRTLTILGCGPSGGVPRINGEWGKCDPKDPRNRRLRCSALIEQRDEDGATTTVLIDTSPDLRQQLLGVHFKRIDAVLFTHDHADHTHGIDDLRPLVFRQKARMPVYFDATTRETLHARFGYAFKPVNKLYPSLLDGHLIEPGKPFAVNGAAGPITFTAFRQDHGPKHSLGFRFADVAYSSDVVGFPRESLPFLDRLDLWILDALRYEPHSTHFSLGEALAWIDRQKPRRAVLTHLLQDLDYETVEAETPSHVAPAYDGMVLDW